jgi:hypothetical protein
MLLRRPPHIIIRLMSGSVRIDCCFLQLLKKANGQRPSMIEMKIKLTMDKQSAFR